jgi:O-antigen ligase
VSGRARLLVFGGAVLLPALLAPLLLVSPTAAIGLAAGVVVVALASRSPVYPVALAGLPAVAIGVTGATDALPQGAVTIFLFAWTVLGVVLATARADDELPLRVLLTPLVVLTILYTVWLLARLGPSLDPAYGSRKLQLFVIGNLTLLVAGIVIGPRAGRVDLFVTVALLMSVLGAAALARGLLSGAVETGVGGRFALTSADSPIGLGREAGRGLLLATYVLLVSRLPWQRLIALCAIPAVAIPFMASGSRGPVVGLIAGLLVLLGTTFRDPARRRNILLIAVGAILAASLVPQLVPGHDVSRTLSIFSGENGGQSSNGRSHLWSLAWTLFTSHPLAGIGTGSFHRFGGVELYPHNLVLEAASELGIVGLVLIVGFLVALAWTCVRAVRGTTGVDRDHAALVAALAAAAVVNAAFSGDVSSNEAVWLAAGMAVGLGRRSGLTAVALSPLQLRRRQRTDVRRAPQPGSAQGGEQPAASGRIVSPPAGAAVGGRVTVEIEPPRVGRPIESLRLEWEAEGGTWATVAELDDRTFDLVVGGEPAAVVRSRRLAELVASTLGAQARPSRRRPWPLGRLLAVDWPTWETPPGGGRLRGVAVDVSGRETMVPEIALTLVPSAPEALPAAPAPQAPDTDERDRDELRRLEGELAQREVSLHERQQELDLTVDEIDERERRLQAELEDVLVRAQEASALRARLNEDRAALAVREQQLSEQARELGERETGTAALLDQVQEARNAVEGEREALAQRERDLEARIAALEEREHDLEARLAALDATATTVEERATAADSLLERVRRERDALEAERQTLAEREHDLEIRLAALDASATSVDERATTADSLLERLQDERDALEAARQALAERERDLEARLAALDATATTVDERAAAAGSLLERVQHERDALEAEREALAEREQRVETQARQTERLRDDVLERARATAAERSALEGEREALAAQARQLAEQRPLAEAVAEIRVAPPAQRVVRGLVELEVAAGAVAAHTVSVEVAPVAGGDWRTAGPGTAVDTGALPDGRWLVRVVGHGAASQPVELLVDNVPPAVRVVAPLQGARLAGTVRVEHDARDDASGLHSVLLQRSRDGLQWRPLVSETWDTTRDDDGPWLLRAVATDNARNVGYSDAIEVVVANRATPAAPVAAQPVAERVSAPTLQELESLVAAAAPRLDPYRVEELQAMLYQLRTFADVSGDLPSQFHALIDEEFGDLL